MAKGGLLLLLLLLVVLVVVGCAVPPLRLRHRRHEHFEPPSQCLFHGGGRECDS